LSGVLGWLTPAERYNGTPFTDRGFQNIPTLTHLQSWLHERCKLPELGVPNVSRNLS